ncbi:teneurin-m-like isoform X2 [Brevipalpus obovatus]|uniref:teneurin-m-like isoform X2 n=1 Tax=Brevipalpus obovatus TaxID=246614 RepID=UPI003D9F2D9E
MSTNRRSGQTPISMRSCVQRDEPVYFPRILQSSVDGCSLGGEAIYAVPDEFGNDTDTDYSMSKYRIASSNTSTSIGNTNTSTMGHQQRCLIPSIGSQQIKTTNTNSKNMNVNNATGTMMNGSNNRESSASDNKIYSNTTSASATTSCLSCSPKSSLIPNREFDPALMMFSSHPTLAGSICVPPDTILRGQQTNFSVLQKKPPFYSSDSRKKLPFNFQWKGFLILFLIISLIIIIGWTCFLTLKSDIDELSPNSNTISASTKSGLERLPNLKESSPSFQSPDTRGGGGGTIGANGGDIPRGFGGGSSSSGSNDVYEEADLGQKLSHKVPSHGHWNIQLYRSNPALIKFSYIIAHGASIGVYGAKNRPPSHTRYDFMEIIDGGVYDGHGRLTRSDRNSIISPTHSSSSPSASSPPASASFLFSSSSSSSSPSSSGHKVHNAEFTKFLDKGIWYISTYNDASHPMDISFIMVTTDDTSARCPYDCSGHGTCVMGKCKCEQDFGGDICEFRACPVLCSGHGDYDKGICRCYAGWKGKECQLREEQCEVPDCNSHGFCTEGQCQCFPGYKGDHCEEVDCLNPDCSGHGVCVNGLCLCGKGWRGADCSEADPEVLRCLPDCSGHGTFNLEISQCICDPKWMGPDCSKEKCDLDCGPNRHCSGGECVCLEGWSGSKCEEKLCDTRCLEHGQCQNGTCICMQGWNGKHCTLEACPRQCNNHGTCLQKDNKWQCACDSNFIGTDCTIPLEKECSDQKDNDGDRLVDCADSECCSTKACQDHQLCQKSHNPLDILLRKSPPSPTASFFQRMQFLIEEESVQNYAHPKSFDDSLFWTRFNARASVIRGQVVGPSGQGLIGVRVGIVEQAHHGFVLTREDGFFDIMVNGGLAVSLNFYRDPFPHSHQTLMVPWNEIVVLDKVKLSLDTKISKESWKSTSICVEHDYEVMKPEVVGIWGPGLHDNCSEPIGSMFDPQVVQERVRIPSTDFNLLYLSSRASGHLSTIELQLTPDHIPNGLRFVHLTISLEGNMEERIFEADSSIRFTYSWNQRNVYRQNVYRMATAVVRVGYEYVNCPQVIWEVRTVELSGHDMDISEIGGWNLDIHHRYNFHEGILHKGDGTNVHLKNKPKMMHTIMGDGMQRPLYCAYCNGPALDQRLLAPVTLASGADGSIYVGDFNLIRRISPEGLVTTIVELETSQVAYRYHLAMSMAGNRLYISDPERHQILRVMNVTGSTDTRKNVEVVVGSGLKCLPGDKSACGDGKPAKDARLAYPKGIAITLSGEMYIADGTNVRFVDIDGIIHTLIGDHYHKMHWKPFPCAGTVPVQKYNPRWPTELAINPLDNSLHILDDHMVLKLTPDKQLRIIAGRPTHCSSVITAQEDVVMMSSNNNNKKESKSPLGNQVFLETPQSIAFSSTGELFIAESDSQLINRVRMVQPDGRIIRYAGIDSDCSCMENDCECFNRDTTLALNSKLSSIPSITVTPDRKLHICDQGNIRIRSVYSTLPQPDEDGNYEISMRDSREAYLFNRFGQHVSTKSLDTSKVKHNFTYDMNTSLGRVIFVVDSSNNKIQLLRSPTNVVESIESSKGGKCRLHVYPRTKLLQSISLPNGHNYSFKYYGTSGLLQKRIDSVGLHTVEYKYDSYGRLIESLQPDSSGSGKDDSGLKRRIHRPILRERKC